MSEKISEFTILVRDMREAQKLYFTTRYGKDLDKAKELEKQVDERLKEIFGWIHPVQGKLL